MPKMLLALLTLGIWLNALALLNPVAAQDWNVLYAIMNEVRQINYNLQRANYTLDRMYTELRSQRR